MNNLQDKINEVNLTKDALAGKIPLELNKETSRNKRKILKIKSENITLYLIKKF